MSIKKLADFKVTEKANFVLIVGEIKEVNSPGGKGKYLEIHFIDGSATVIGFFATKTLADIGDIKMGDIAKVTATMWRRTEKDEPHFVVNSLEKASLSDLANADVIVCEAWDNLHTEDDKATEQTNTPTTSKTSENVVKPTADKASDKTVQKPKSEVGNTTQEKSEPKKTEKEQPTDVPKPSKLETKKTESANSEVPMDAANSVTESQNETSTAISEIDGSFKWRKGDKISLTCLLKILAEKVAKNGSSYLAMELAGPFGSIDAKKWDTIRTDIPDVKQGCIVVVEGVIDEWIDKRNDNVVVKQLIVETIRLATNNDIGDISAIIPVAPIEGIAMYHQILDFIATFKHAGLKNLLQTVYIRYKERLIVCPGALTVHHSFRSGLLFHKYQMLRDGISKTHIYFGDVKKATLSIEEMIKSYSPELTEDKSFNAELFYAVILLHDIGKIFELEVNEYGVATGYTLEGSLIGHTVIGYRVVSEIAKEIGLDEELTILIQHCILTHHYEEKFGAFNKPMFLEAEELHHLDMSDSRLNIMMPILKNIQQGLFSERIPYLDNRTIYHHKDI